MLSTIWYRVQKNRNLEVCCLQEAAVLVATQINFFKLVRHGKGFKMTKKLLHICDLCLVGEVPLWFLSTWYSVMLPHKEKVVRTSC